MTKITTLLISLLIALSFTSCDSQSNATKNVPTKALTQTTSNTHNPIVVLQTTKGDLEIELFPEVAPLAVENFMTHIKNGYYNGIAFHRIIKDFMIQGGDPTESGRKGESIWHKDFKDEFKDKVFDSIGVLAMANRGPATNGSQFFITTAPTPWLNGKHTIFGHIVNSASYDTLSKLNLTPVVGSKPNPRVQIDKAYIKSEGK